MSHQGVAVVYEKGGEGEEGEEGNFEAVEEMGVKVTGYVSGAQAHGAIHHLRCLTDAARNFEQAVTVVFEVSEVSEVLHGQEARGSNR